MRLAHGQNSMQGRAGACLIRNRSRYRHYSYNRDATKCL